MSTKLSVMENHQQLVEDLTADPQGLKGQFEKLNLSEVDLVHGIIGIATEGAGELLDQVKAYLAYGKPFDRVHLIEEFGDLLFYTVLGLAALGVDIPTAMEANIRKLEARYKGRIWTQDAALKRDLPTERKALNDSIV